MNKNDVNNLIILIETFFKNQELKLLEKILSELSFLSEKYSKDYYSNLLNKNNNNDYLKKITFLKDFSIELKKNLNNIEEINKLLKYNVIYFKSL